MHITREVKFKDPTLEGVTIWPFILINKDLPVHKWNTTLNHERVHICQYQELLWIFFILWYYIEFLVKAIKYKSWDEGYRNISFEKEAYQNQRNLNYLKTRRFWAFIKYL